MPVFASYVVAALVRRTLLFGMKTILLALVLAVFARAVAQQSEFMWVTGTNRAALLGEVKAAFSSDLTADRYDPQSHTVPMTVKFIERVGIRGNSALVIIGERGNKTDPYAVYRAFMFDLRTKTKMPVRSKGVEWMWMWRLEKVAHLTAADDTDVIFQFLDCTECEATRLLASFHYIPSTGWEVRQWSKEDGAAIVIGSDPQFGDDGLYRYNCLHAVTDVTGSGLDEVAVRCKEWLQPDMGKSFKRLTSDKTVLYTAKQGRLARIIIGKSSEMSHSVQQALCATKPTSPLCRRSSH